MRNFIIIIFVLITIQCFPQSVEPIIRKNKYGCISSVEFSINIDKSKVLKSADVFFKDYLNISDNDGFERKKRIQKKEFIHEHFDQYYKGLRVDGAGYNFHYKNGKMYFANGNYVKIDKLDVIPKITLEEAKNCFASYKNIPIDEIVDYKSELIIKEFNENDITSIRLVYKLFLIANQNNSSDIGYIDAENCKILFIEPDLVNISSIGTFETRYSNTQQAVTHNYSGYYHLVDSTHGAVIHTWNLNGSIYIQDREEIRDNDNNWTATEHSATENDMGLDVHWALQKIYDHLYNNYGINSFDNNGKGIDAYVRYGTMGASDNAGWSSSLELLAFGDGAVLYSPLASLDVVAHEFGHGISHYQIGWGNSGTPGAFSEGLSDIWGVILESRIRPNSIWTIGEQVTLENDCIRNIENTNDIGAYIRMADTYLASQYNSDTSKYVRSGIFSHWFYLLVNGGSGTNDFSNSYKVYGMGLDVAEDLIVESVFNNYLNYTTTYPDLKTSIVNAARSLYSGYNDFLIQQIENAWYAVGVGSEPTQVYLSSPTTICYTGSTFTLNNLPSGIIVNWTKSDNLSYIGHNGDEYTFAALSPTVSGEGWVNVEISDTNCNSINLINDELWIGKPSGAYIDCINQDYMQVGDMRTYFLSPNPGNPTSYNWWITGNPVGIEFFYPANEPNRTVEAIEPSRNTLYAQTINQCGTSMTYGRLIIVRDDGLWESLLTVYPNPANDYFEVEIEGNDIESDVNDKINIQLFNNMSMSVYTSVIKQKRFSINTSNLPNGLYQLQIIYKGEKYNQQILIEH